MRIRIRIAYVFIAVTYIATECSILFGCHPMHKNWQINPNPGSMLPHIYDQRTVPNEYSRLLPTRRVQDRYLCDGDPQRRNRLVPHEYPSSGIAMTIAIPMS